MFIYICITFVVIYECITVNIKLGYFPRGLAVLFCCDSSYECITVNVKENTWFVFS